MWVADLFSMQDAGIYSCGTKIVSRLYRRNISREHEVYVLHGKPLRITTPTCSSLYSEGWAFGGLTKGIYDVESFLGQSLTKPEGCHCFTFTQGCWSHGGYGDYLTVRLILQPLQNLVVVYLGHVLAMGLKLLIQNPGLLRHLSYG